MTSTRSRDAVVQLKARMREPLRARLEVAAKWRGVSLNAELVDRLERSFAKDDAFGGLVIANAARLMAAAFLQGGQHEAHAHYPHWRPADWINSSACYDAAVRAVVRALKSVRPINLPPPEPLTTELRKLRAEDDLVDDFDEASKTVALGQQPEGEPSDER